VRFSKYPRVTKKVVATNNMSSKIAKTGGLKKPAASTIPNLPVVNGNANNPTGYVMWGRVCLDWAEFFIGN
jgi:hypothetical protein